MIGKKAIYRQNGEIVTIAKVRQIDITRDLAGRKLVNPHTSISITVTFCDGEEQTTGIDDIELMA